MQWHLKNTAALFTGEVIEIVKKPNGIDEADVLIKLKVKEFWKGDLSEEIVIDTELSMGGNCGYNFQLGKEYLIYAYNSDNKNLVTKACDDYGNHEVGKVAKVLKILGKGKKIENKNQSGT